MSGLIKDKVEIPLGLGIQTDVDDKLLPVGKVVALENGVWLRGGEIVKRTGSYSLGSQYAANTPGNMPKAWQLATHKGAAVSLSVAGPRPIGVYSPGVGKWVAPAGSTALDNINGVFSKLRGTVLPQRMPVFRGNSAGEASRTVFNPDVATNGTYAAVAWLESTTTAETARMYVVELATGKKLFEYSQALTFGQGSVRVVFVNGEFDLIYRNGANLRGRFWTAANIAGGAAGWQPSAEFTLATDNATNVLDAIAGGNDLYVLYNAANPRIAKATGGVSSGVVALNTLTNSGGGALNAGQLAWMRDLSASGARSAIVGSAAQGVTVQWNITGGLPTASYTMDAAAGQPLFLAGATITNNGTGEFVVLWEVAGPPQSIRWGRRSGGVVSGPSTWILSGGLASTMWAHSGAFYILTRYDSAEQGTFFVSRVPTNITDATDNTRTPSARFCSGQAVTLSAVTFSLPTVTPLSTDVILAGANVKVRLVSSPGVEQFDTGVDLVRLTYNPANVNSPREFADNLYVCGGMLCAFDGITYAEEGFHLFPEQPTVVQQVGGGLELLGTYQACALYRYTDNFGRVRRSPVSDPVQFTMTGSNRGAQVTVKTLKFHGRPCRVNDGGRPGSVVIEYYRTTNNVSDLFQLAAVVDNDESVDTITIVDTASDVSVALSEVLYTGNPGNTQGAFDTPPPVLACVPYKDRLAVIDADDPTLIWVSLPLSPVEGPRFNAESTIRIDDSFGGLTGLAAIDEKLIPFKSNAIYAIAGDGPDVNGTGSFGIAQFVGKGIGCVEPRSIAEVPDGVLFRPASKRAGYHLVNRGLALEYAGKDVEQFITGDIASFVTIADAVHMPDLARTDIMTNLGTTLSYDHTLKLWATSTNQAALAATEWNGRHLYQANTGFLFLIAEQPNDDQFDDTSSPVELYLETPWVALNQLKGYERFYATQLVGEKRIIEGSGDPGYIADMTIWRDYDKSTPLAHQTRTMAVTDDPNLLELKYSAKLSAIKVGLRIKMNPIDGSNFAGPKLSTVVLRYGRKEGLKKTAYTNRTT